MLNLILEYLKVFIIFLTQKLLPFKLKKTHDNYFFLTGSFKNFINLIKSKIKYNK